MLKFYLAALLAALTLTFQTTSTLASCAPPATVAENTARADIVITGTITDTSNSYSLITVETYYKGQGADFLKVTGRISPNSYSSVDLELTKGAKYLLFLKGEPKDILQANACNGSRILTNGLSREEQSGLDTGATPSAKPAAVQGRDSMSGYALAAGLTAALLLYLLRVRKII